MVFTVVTIIFVSLPAHNPSCLISMALMQNAVSPIIYLQRLRHEQLRVWGQPDDSGSTNAADM